MVVAFLGAAGTASAFVSEEHGWISRRAICIARVHLERTAGEPTRREQQAIEVLAVLSEGNDDLPDYGDLVAYPDYVTFPNEMLDTSRTGRARIAALHVRGRVGDRIANYSELLHNPHHFRLLGVSQFHLWHEIAVARAVDVAAKAQESDPLFDALAYNAYADHFLEDFFAPGHMTREPDGVSHMGNLRIHDTDNWAGRSFQPAERTAALLGAVIGSTPEERDEIVSRCFSPKDGITTADLEAATSSRAIRLQGDNQLYREKDGIQQGRKRQAVFVALVVSRSILDVVESYTRSERQNTFPNRRCRSAEEGSAATAFPSGDCYFVVDENEDNPSFAGMGIGRYLSEPDAARVPWVWPTLGLSTELQETDGTSRWQSSLEVLFDLPLEPALRGVGIESELTQHLSAELGAGYSYVNKGAFESGDDYHGHGPDLRVYVRAKQLYMFVSGEVGWRWYGGLGKNTNNFRAAGRLGFGNGIFWAYGTIGRDSRPTSSGSEDDALIAGFGVEMTIPSTRVLGWAAGR